MSAVSRRSCAISALRSMRIHICLRTTVGKQIRRLNMSTIGMFLGPTSKIISKPSISATEPRCLKSMLTTSMLSLSLRTNKLLNSKLVKMNMKLRPRISLLLPEIGQEIIQESLISQNIPLQAMIFSVLRKILVRLWLSEEDILPLNALGSSMELARK